ncbi:hypothetical protein [Nocardia lijiangensis]|uniref:hypothetical protein n=1 Tax=Nocardia lijiangensis TaxID=299618 RepID=UPI000829C5D1
MAAKVTRLRTPPSRTLRSAAEAFLDTIGSANTRRAYGIAIVKTVDALDGDQNHIMGGVDEPRHPRLCQNPVHVDLHRSFDMIGLPRGIAVHRWPLQEHIELAARPLAVATPIGQPHPQLIIDSKPVPLSWRRIHPARRQPPPHRSLGHTERLSSQPDVIAGQTTLVRHLREPIDSRSPQRALVRVDHWPGLPDRLARNQMRARGRIRSRTVPGRAGFADICVRPGH